MRNLIVVILIVAAGGCGFLAGLTFTPQGPTSGPATISDQTGVQAAADPAPQPAPTPAAVQIEVCFVPGPTDCAQLIADHIAQAHSTIDFQAYNFTDQRIADALVAAEQRGVKVRAVVDKTAPNERGGKIDELEANRIPVWIDRQPRIAHNKVIVIDGQMVVGGSFNYTVSADTHNAENVTIIHDASVAGEFDQNFESRLAVSEAAGQ